MNGKNLALVLARMSDRMARFADIPNTVIAALVLSVCVAAGSGYMVLAKAWPHLVKMSINDLATVAGPMARPEPLVALVRPAMAPAVPAAFGLGFTDPGVARARPVALVEADVPTPPRLAAPMRVIAGRPAVVPPPRPAVVPPPRPTHGAGVVQLADGLSAARARTLPGPMARPTGTIVAAVWDVVTPPVSVAVVQIAPMQRPALRPANLLARRAPAPDEAEILLASATVPETMTRPRLLDPTPPRAGANPCSSRLARAIPRRPSNAAGGAAVMAAIGNSSGPDRDAALVAQALGGNIPDNLRSLQPVSFAGIVGGRQTQITLCVTPDYLAIGSNADHVRVPLGLPAALRVADGFDMMLPTTRMVDAIYAQADLRVSPAPMPPTSAMSSTDYFLRHDSTVDAQFARAGARDGLLVAGHKKDVVIANRLSNAPGRVAIYGWHRANGDPIQPLSTVHGEYYADYSHGIRLVARTAYVDGRAVDLRALLTDGQYAGLLNTDGPLTGAAIRLASLR